jgi:CspA family cold shock protein
MARGTVKWFNSKKGYGFIRPQDGGRDVFVHFLAAERAGLATLKEGQTVEYEEVSNRGRTSLENADSDDCGRGFRLNAATRSDRRRPPVPTKAAGVSLPA